MDVTQIQETIEQLVVAGLDGGSLVDKVFRINDTEGRVATDMITVSCGAPEPQLEAFGGFMVEVEIEMRSKTPTANAAIHGEAMRRLQNFAIMKAAALSIGLTEEDDIELPNEQISGDRSKTKNLRKRSITVPFLISFRAI